MRQAVEVVAPDRRGFATADLAAIAETFGLDVGGCRAIPWARDRFFRKSLTRTLNSATFALTVTNGYPIALTTAHVSVLQFPWEILNWSAARRADATAALQSCALVVTYSEYVRAWVERSLDFSPVVLYPPVAPISETTKMPMIISVGRMTSGGHNKKHALMIAAFRKLREMPELADWSLVLVGSAGPNDMGYVRSLQRISSDLPVEVRPNLPRGELRRLYGAASIYWHAAGYGEDEGSHPERFEHFGISVVEAMSAGAVPITFKGGGLPEIVTPDAGYLWEQSRELMDATRTVIESPTERGRLALAAKSRAEAFAPQAFEARFLDELVARGLVPA